MNASAHRKRSLSKKAISLPIACAYAFVAALASALILLFVATIIAYAQADPTRVAVPASLGVLYLSTLIGGAVASRLSDVSLLFSAVFGTVYLFFTFLLSVFPFGDASCGFAVIPSLLARIAIIGAALLGGFIGKKREKRPSGRNKKRRR
ncbi:MAG: hypothetical protein IKB87_02935 [Clostridia bacterium]|nr:hypothetical protein [Clostridia bacterium]